MTENNIINDKITQDYVLNNYRMGKIKDKYLITTDHGSFIALSKNDYHNLIHENFKYELFKKLEKAGVVITKKNELDIIDASRMKKAFLNHGASLHIIVVTLRCNQFCTYCQASRKSKKSKNKDMDLETAKKTVDFIFQSPSHGITIEFQGGEPLLNFPIVEYIIKYALKLNKKFKRDLRFNLVTNMILMDDEKLNVLFKYKIGICTSLDGPKTLHDLNRPYIKGKSSYEETIKGLNKIKDKKKIDKSFRSYVNAILTISKNSLNFHKEIIDEYVKQDFRQIFFRQVSELGLAHDLWSKIGYNANDFIDFYKKGLEYIIKNKLPIKERLTVIILKKILDKYDPNYLDLRSPCGAAIGQLAYNYDGSIFSCDEGRMVGDIFKIGTINQTYKEVLTCDETCSLIASSVNDIYLCDKCVYKSYCGVCPVVNYATQGNLIPNLAQDMRCKIYKEIFNHVFDKLLNDDEYREVLNEWVKFDLLI